jgi:hypothetical protein
VLFEPLPRGYEGIPMCRVPSLALTAQVRSDVLFSTACLEAWARLDELVVPDSEPGFIEQLVAIGKERRPPHAPLRNTRPVAFGGFGQCKRCASARQVAQAAGGRLGAPSPGAVDPLWVPPAAAAGEALFPYDVAPPGSRPGAMGEVPVSVAHCGGLSCLVAGWMVARSRAGVPCRGNGLIAERIKG